MSGHDSILEDLAAYVAGRLEPARRREFEAWVEANPEYRELVSDWTRIAEGLQNEGRHLGDSCPDANALRGWALGKSPAPTAHTERHVSTCASCSLEVAAARGERQAAPRVASTTTRPATGAPAFRVASWAAAAGLALGLGLGLVLDGPEAPLPGGLERPLVLEPSVRSGGGGSVFTLPDGQSRTPILVPFELPEGLSPGTTLRLSISGGAGEIWGTSATVADLAARLDDGLLFVEPHLPGPGRYTLAIAREDLPEAPLLRIPFEIR